MNHIFVDLPDKRQKVFLFNRSDGKKFREVLWGDFLFLDDSVPDTDPDWRFVVWGRTSANPKHLKIRREFTTDQRPLEIIFVDVGQGDGAVLITPERNEQERIFVIDAGEGAEMGEFLDKRFRAYRKGFKFHAAVVTHPDKDHYFGFKPIFDSGRVKFKHLYHNGICERPTGSDFAGAGGQIKIQGVNYLRSITPGDQEFRDLYKGKSTDRDFAGTMKPAVENDLVDQFEMLSTQHGTAEDGKSWVPGFEPSKNRGYTIEIVGPFVETINGIQRLRRSGNYAETKNGHSVLLKLCHNDFKILFGGDLNLKAEKRLLMAYSGLGKWPSKSAEREAMIAKGREIFGAEVMKVCHHGAADVTDEFLEAVNPAAFVISSGDAEGHVHPRPDLLGRLGKKGYGASPVLLSTELQRSVRDKQDEKLLKRLRDNIDKQVKKEIASRAKAINEDLRSLARSNVDVDGAIYLKTDGKRLITAFKKESDSDTDKWFYFEYQVINGELVLQPD